MRTGSQKSEKSPKSETYTTSSHDSSHVSSKDVDDDTITSRKTFRTGKKSVSSSSQGDAGPQINIVHCCKAASRPCQLERTHCCQQKQYCCQNAIPSPPPPIRSENKTNYRMSTNRLPRIQSTSPSLLSKSSRTTTQNNKQNDESGEQIIILLLDSNKNETVAAAETTDSAEENDDEDVSFQITIQSPSCPTNPAPSSQFIQQQGGFPSAMMPATNISLQQFSTVASPMQWPYSPYYRAS